MNILGISAFYHDSAAALVVDGEIVAAAQEERFSRKKHDASFPAQAVDYVLQHAGLTPADIDHVAYYEKPLLKFERLLDTYLAYAPAGFRSFTRAMPPWLKEKLHLPKEINKALHGEFCGRLLFPEHHESHAASAFYPSPFQEAAILTLDGVGEWATTTIGKGQGNQVELLQETRFPHSLGLLYTAFTYYCGFRVNSGEYKLMGLAPYGQPKYAEAIKEHLIELKDDGSFQLDMAYFNYPQGLTMTSRKFHRLFGRPPRDPEAELEPFHMDLAASIQQVTEEAVLKMAAHARSATGLPNLVLAGGVALNCVANGRILKEGIFDKIWVQPAAGDAGGALGAALFAWHQLLDKPRTPKNPDAQSASALGYTDDQIAQELAANTDAVFQRAPDEASMVQTTVDALAGQQVVGWFQGRMEFGPRALGRRSIIADPRGADMQRKLNLKVKFRESFRPFAPTVLAEDAHEYFDLPSGCDSPYMLLVSQVTEKHHHPDAKKQLSQATGLDKLDVPRSDIPAVTHIDFSARAQTVDPVRHPTYHHLHQAWKAATGCPVLINTSFNVRGEPIVCTPTDAYRCFMHTDIDLLVMGNLILKKSDQPRAKSNHSATFPLD